MKNNLYIDGTDAFTRFGVFIAEGGHNEVVAFPALKAPEVSNDWAEYDGIEVDLSDPKLDTKELEIKFNAVGMYQTGDFISLLSDGAYHTFEFKRIGYNCKLRLVSEVNVALYIGAKSFSLKSLWHLQNIKNERALHKIQKVGNDMATVLISAFCSALHSNNSSAAKVMRICE